MSEERRTRIAELEGEAQKLRVQELNDRHAVLEAKVKALFEGLHLEDIPAVETLISNYGHKLWLLEHSDDE